MATGIAIIVILILAAIVGVCAYRQWQKKQKEKRREQERLERERAEALAKEHARLEQLIDELIPSLVPILHRFRTALDFDSGYLMKKDWDALVSEAAPVAQKLEDISSDALERHSRSKDISEFLKYQQDSNVREARNASYKQSELERFGYLLDDIDGKSLDDQQRDAVVTDEYSNLVIAGAGSGKTLTVVGKIKYLVDRWGISPEEILVTSFTRKSVEELSERIKRAGIEGVSTRTFHSLGLNMLGDVGIANENELRICIQKYFFDELVGDSQQVQAYLEFYGCCNYLPLDYEEFGDEGKRFEDLKAADLETIKGKLEHVKASSADQLDTLQGERVKSLEELMIANYLFLHGIAYEYEKNYTGDYKMTGRAYQPDFYLSDYGIWLEHFGINENGEAPWIKNAFEEQRYLDGMAWKRSVHKQNNTKLIESYSYWNKDQDLLNKLEKLLTDNGVVLTEDSEQLVEMYELLSQNDEHYSGMVSLVQTFVSLAKANNLSADEIEERAREAYKGNGYMWHRFQLFMTFVRPIMSFYAETLRKKNQVDFDDMINKAAEVVSKEGIAEHYKYIIVDEYQDISMSRFGLVRAIREKTGAKLVCVGDDWQSIYRFAGSDVTLFMNFGRYVGDYEALRIEATYRNSQELVNVASKFVEKNPAQIHKSMRAKSHRVKPIVVLASHEMRAAFEQALDTILSSQDDYDGHILILGRHNFDLENLYPDLEDTDAVSFTKDRKSGDIHINYRGYSDIVFMSVHRAKGLEADDVVVINLVNSMYGFPNRLEDDPILTLLLDNEDSYPFAEERRLFYVAITRTKKNVYLISERIDGDKTASPFVKELLSDSTGNVALFTDEESQNPVLCPRCGTGTLVVRTNKQTGKQFLGCTNYPFCDKSYNQTEILEDRVKCPRCGGWMVRRTRRSDGSPFFGCSNYPDCDATISIETDESIEYAVEGFDDFPEKRSNYSSHGRNPREHLVSAKCPKCGSPMRKRSGKHGDFYGCSRYPKCKATLPACPQCGAPMVKREGHYGTFWGCSNYPECRCTKNIQDNR